jgi:hypothetical protein
VYLSVEERGEHVATSVVEVRPIAGGLGGGLLATTARQPDPLPTRCRASVVVTLHAARAGPASQK